jgi:hypothetical protein
MEHSFFIQILLSSVKNVTFVGSLNLNKTVLISEGFHIEFVTSVTGEQLQQRSGGLHRGSGQQPTNVVSVSHDSTTATTSTANAAATTTTTATTAAATTTTGTNRSIFKSTKTSFHRRVTLHIFRQTAT